MTPTPDKKGAATNSERREGWAVPMDRIDAFTSGAALAVEPDAIEKELTALWRQAAERAQKTGSQLAVMRACLWNLVVHVAGEEPFRQLKGLLDKLSEAVPTRLIVIVEAQGGDGADFDATSLRASVEANLRQVSGGKREVISEEITLEAPRLEARRVLQLVRSLLLADLPTAVFFAGDVPDTATGAANATGAPSSQSQSEEARGQLRQMIGEVDRVILDTAKLGGARGAARAIELLYSPGAADGGRHARHPADTYTGPEVADLGWLRLSPWRALVAQLFDPADARPALAALDEVRIEHTAQAAVGAALLGGWLMSRLGWRRGEPDPKDGHRRKLLDPDGRQVTLTLAAAAGKQADAEDAPGGIQQVTLRAGTQVFRATATSARVVELTSPVAPTMTQVVPARADNELLVTALGAGGRDPLLHQALVGSLMLLPGAPNSTEAAGTA